MTSLYIRFCGNKHPTLPETNIAHENPIFPGKYHQNCGFSMAMLVSGRVSYIQIPNEKQGLVASNRRFLPPT